MTASTSSSREAADDEAGAADDEAGAVDGAFRVLRRGLAAMPELRRGLWFTALMGLAMAAARVSAPVVLQQALDKGGLTSGDVDMDAVLRFVGLGVVLVLTATMLGWLAHRRLVLRSEASLHNLRSRAFAKVHQLSIADHGEARIGALTARVTSDVQALSRFAEWGLFSWTLNPLLIACVLLAIGWYSWPLALLSVLVMLPAIPLLRMTQIGMLRAHDRKRTAVGDVMTVYGESIAGAEVVRAYAIEDRMQRSMGDASEEQYRAGIRANFFMSTVYVIGDLLGALLLVSILGVGFWQRETLGLDGGEFVAILFLVTMLYSPIGELGETLNTLQEAIAAWRKILNLIDQPVEVVDRVDGLTIAAGPVAINVVNLGFAYRDSEPVLRDVSVAIPAGASVAIVGESGSGKTTFAKLLCRLADPGEGRIELNGTRLGSLSAEGRLAAVRLVPQDGFLFDATVRENIALGRDDATDADVHRAIDMLDLQSWVDNLPAGLDTRVGERGSALSVGERQLVALARASVADPGLLILDEATSSVDPETDLGLTRALRRLAEGRTVVSIAHRMATAEAADLVLVFDDGEIVQQGTHDALVAVPGIYQRLHEAWEANVNEQVQRAT